MGARRFLQVGIVLLCVALAVGGLLFYQLIYLPHTQWRAENQWRGENLNHPSAVGTQILEGTVNYLSTKPKYDGTKIYPGGVPNDGTGVCTDVIWYGAKAAGMDIRTLLDQDKRANPEAYGNEAPNADIDYRRVRNLIIYFKRHAQALTTDKTDVAAWQPGDIVVFHEHVGVVSDRRNSQGLPFVLHHQGGIKAPYESDAINERGEVVGHFRLG